MAKLTSAHLTEIDTQLNNLKQQVAILEEQRNTELQSLFCEAEGLIAGESIIKTEGKSYVFSHAKRNVEHSTETDRVTPTVFGYQILSNGKKSESLRAIYNKWQKHE